MARRTTTPATPAPAAPLPPAPRDIASLAESDPQWAANLHTLRTHWKWANFSQFFYTFAPLLNMPDVFLADVEDDLARGTNLYLPRIMHRLLYTLSQDRKTTIDNWQTTLRRQYLRRAPELNPIGPEPKIPSRESSVTPSEAMDEGAKEDVKDATPLDANPAGNAENPTAHETTEGETKAESSSSPKAEPQDDAEVPAKSDSDQKPKEEEPEESKDWLDLPMLAKLDSLQLLTDWQFHNPYKVRQLMKDDDDTANWRIEPIGYDAKTNAYWLIGPDRLWIQRVPPKPPRTRNLKRKRPAAKKVVAKPSTSRAVESSEEEDDEPAIRIKCTRTQTRSSRPQANGRATRASRRSTRASSPAPDLSSPGKSTRAAKVQANKKLDLQAKELAEFQRQTAQLKAKANSSPRATRKAARSPTKRAMGTRVSARLRRSTRGTPDEDDDEDDDEWQQVPDEWLQEDAPSTRRTSARTRAKGKARAVEDDEDSPDDAADSVPGGDTDGAGDQDAETADKDTEAAVDAEGHDLLQKAGLESDADSELTDLSDDQSDEDAQMTEADVPEERPVRTRRTRGRGGKSVGGRRTSARQRGRPARGRAQQTKRVARDEASPDPDPEPEAEAVPEPVEKHEDEPPVPALPADFVEWEAIAVTLPEWEHVADRFANATHYLEKALYKVLSQSVVPYVVEEMKEHEKRRRMEEAIVHRKRSSRIAIKESEKEEARLAAKRKAEEDEKMARARRQEARLKKEEAERTKRDRAREQRRKERDEREARARAKAERAASKDVSTSAARSTATPTVNGTQASLSSVQPSRVVTPSGARSQDWILDCEICHKQGINVDDGLAMVSCGSCGRWQHIPCHDLNDQRSGRPRRNWEDQQFYCARCRQRAMNGGSSYGAHQPHGYSQHHSQHNWPEAGRSVQLHKPPGMNQYGQTSDLRYSHRSPVENGAGYHSQQQYSSNHVGTASYSRSSYPNHGFSFPHYQSDHHAMPARSTLPSPSQSSWGNGSGYPSSAEHMTGRMQSAHFVPQYPHNGGVHSSNRIPSGRAASATIADASLSQSSTSPTIPHYHGSHDTPGTMSAARWPSSSTTNGYHSPNGSAVQTAAESLAFMHDTGSRYSGGTSSWPQQSYGQGQQQRHMHYAAQQSLSSHQSRSYSQGQLGVDPLTGHPFQAPRAEQQVGSSMSNGSSFNFSS
ncbi:hypothetical protein BD413DRAFT_487618 [Trametes elegans]|nr:hypothetical protein BD413DRAFT_487618 [Trametes elegans]